MAVDSQHSMCAAFDAHIDTFPAIKRFIKLNFHIRPLSGEFATDFATLINSDD
jgi:hypothetical protein